MVSERDDVVSLSEVNNGPQLPHTLPLLLNQTTTKDLQQKRKRTRYLTVYTKEMGNSVPED